MSVSRQKAEVAPEQVARRIKGSVCTKQYGYEELLSPLIAQVLPCLRAAHALQSGWRRHAHVRLCFFLPARAMQALHACPEVISPSPGACQEDGGANLGW